MPLGPLTRNFAKLAVNLRVHRQALIVFFEESLHACSLFGRIECPGGKVVRRNRLVIHLPRHPVHVAKTPHPRAGPIRQSKRCILARQFAVARREKLHFRSKSPRHSPSTSPGTRRENATSTCWSNPSIQAVYTRPAIRCSAARETALQIEIASSFTFHVTRYTSRKRHIHVLVQSVNPSGVYSPGNSL